MLKEIEEIILKIAAPQDTDLIACDAQSYLDNLNSLRFIELITVIEEKYDIRFANEDLMKLAGGGTCLQNDFILYSGGIRFGDDVY